MPKVFAFYNRETGRISGYGSSNEPGTVELDIPEGHRFLADPGLFILLENGAIEFLEKEERRVTESVLRRKQIEFLEQTDWLVARHRDQLDLGIETTLSNEEYQKLLTDRQAARDQTLEFTE